MNTVNILVSTYNGEKYIKQQIDSLLNQTYSDIKIFVRDDGSNDNTKKILEDYKKYKNIVVKYGNNLGYGRSFLTLLYEVDTGAYWAFCDQDDVWDKDKIKNAISHLEKMNPNIPNMYVHDFYITDEHLNELEKYGNSIGGYDFRMSITECLHMGFSTVFNSEFRRLMLSGNINNIPSHDWWAELIAMEFGNIYIDNYIGAWHRRLDISISENNISNRVKWFRKAISGKSEISYITKEFFRVFSGDMNEKDKKILKMFVNEKYNWNSTIKKVFYPKRWRTNFASEIIIRLLMLLGKI